MATWTRIALACFALASAAAAQDAVTDPPKRPRIGLVLSGGGARGAAHIGVLRVLEELRVPIDYIAANSMGSLIGGIYSYGYSPQEMDDLIRSLDWSRIIRESIPRDDMSFRRKQDDKDYLVKVKLGVRDLEFRLPKGLVQGHAIGNFLRFVMPQSNDYTDFDDLPVPFRAVATDITTGELVVLDSGSLTLAMQASMSIPGVFAPVDIDGRQLVDGLVVNNIPIDVARDMGADVVIAIDIGGKLLEAEQISSLIGVTEQMVAILTQANVDEQLATLTEGDILLQPELGDITSSSFPRVAEAIEIGEHAARAIADELRKFSVSEAEYARYLEHQRLGAVTYPRIDEVRIQNNSGLGDEVIAARVRTKAGKPFDPVTLQEDIDRLYGLGDFERVTFELTKTEDEKTRLDLIADEKSWGPNYLRFSLRLVDDFDGGAFYQLGVNYTMQVINSLGGELRNEVLLGRAVLLASEFYQPIEPTQTLFASASVRYDRRPLRIFDMAQLVTEYTSRSLEGALDVGVALGTWGEFRFGYKRATGTNSSTFANAPVSEGDFEDGLLAALLRVDTLDNVAFPRFGSLGIAEWLGAWTWLGADADWQRLRVAFGHFQSFGSTTFGLDVDVSTALAGTVPPHRLQPRGGFLSISGLRQAELLGQHSALAQLIAYHHLSGSPTAALGMPLYVGASVETGNAWQRREDVFEDLIVGASVFLGTDTPLGPLYFGYGRADDGQDSLYLFLGQIQR